MRQLGHKLVGVFFWVLTFALWLTLALEHKAGVENITYSASYLGVVSGAVLAVTAWWIRHNTNIYRRKGPRTGRPELPPVTGEDRLGRPIRWLLEGGAADAPAIGHLVVELDGGAKVYKGAG